MNYLIGFLNLVMRSLWLFNMISIIIPTLNESLALPETLRRVGALGAGHELIIVDGGSTDATCDIAQSHVHSDAKENERVQLIKAVRGRANQMNAGAEQASGEWLLFLHADTFLPKDALNEISQLPETVMAGGFMHRFSGSAWGLSVISWLHNFRCRRTHVFYGDQAFFIRRTLFESLGGFPRVPRLEDLIFGEQVQKITQPVLLNSYIITGSRKFEQMGVWRSLWRVMIIQMRHELGLEIQGTKFFADVR